MKYDGYKRRVNVYGITAVNKLTDDLLQPNISKYSRELLPLLFNYISETEASGVKDPKGLINSYYALEMFCENLG